MKITELVGDFEVTPNKLNWQQIEVVHFGEQILCYEKKYKLTLQDGSVMIGEFKSSGYPECPDVYFEHGDKCTDIYKLDVVIVEEVI